MHTELHAAAYRGETEKAERLIKEHPEWVQTSNNGMPLHAAAGKGHKAIVVLLLSAGAHVDARTDEGRTPLHRAAADNHVGVAEVLLARGADVNARCKYQTTPLHWAARMGHRQVTELLLTKGAVPDSADDMGGTPLQQAEVGAAKYGGMTGHREVVALLTSALAKKAVKTN